MLRPVPCSTLLTDAGVQTASATFFVGTGSCSGHGSRKVSSVAQGLCPISLARVFGKAQRKTIQRALVVGYGWPVSVPRRESHHTLDIDHESLNGCSTTTLHQQPKDGNRHPNTLTLKHATTNNHKNNNTENNTNTNTCAPPLEPSLLQP